MQSVLDCRNAKTRDQLLLQKISLTQLAATEGVILARSKFSRRRVSMKPRFSCGEGCALLINDERMIDRAEVIPEKGTNRSTLIRGEVAKYTWGESGQAICCRHPRRSAVCLTSKPRTSKPNGKQSAFPTAINWYHGQKLTDLERLTFDLNASAYHVYYLMPPQLESRMQFIQHIKDCNIISVFNCLRLRLSEVGLKYGGKPGQCPVWTMADDSLIQLPFLLRT